MLAFENFELESPTSCRYNSLQVFDGTSNKARRIGGKVCGSKTTTTVLSKGDSLYLQLTSDATKYKKSFKVTYRLGESKYGGNKLNILIKNFESEFNGDGFTTSYIFQFVDVQFARETMATIEM